MKSYHLVILTCIAFLISCNSGSTPQGISSELSEKIKADARITQIEKMAEELVATGLRAGDGYGEVWIRDLNSFVETACHVGNQQKIKESLILFFKFQGEDGNIPDGYVPNKPGNNEYYHIQSKYEPSYSAHKNTVETDQETSLVQAVYKYIYATKDKSILEEKVGDKTLEQRMSDAMKFLLNERYNEKYGLIWGATTADWGDVQPEHDWGVVIDSSTHYSIDIYDNAMFIIAMNNLVEMSNYEEDKQYWKKTSAQIKENTRKHLWDTRKNKFIPHIYIDGSPFPADFDENAIHYHGGTTMAIEADLLNIDEIRIVYNQMQQNVKDAKAQTVGLTMYPPYPNGFFKNPGMGEYGYQNGGDWMWFGGRTVQQLINYGLYDEAYEAMSPMLDLVANSKGFYEWWTPAGEPRGSASFRGAAGVLWKSIQLFKEEIAKK